MSLTALHGTKNVARMYTARLIDHLLFSVPLKDFSLIWKRHHCLWEAANFGPCLAPRTFQELSEFYRVKQCVPFQNFLLSYGDVIIAGEGLWGKGLDHARAAKFTPMLGAQGLLVGGIFIVSHSRIFFLWHGDVAIVREGLQNLQLCPMLGAQGHLGGRDFYRVTQYVPFKNFFSEMKTSPLSLKGWKIYTYVRRSRPLRKKGSWSCKGCKIYTCWALRAFEHWSLSCLTF
jgi:hypothetical protein